METRLTAEDLARITSVPGRVDVGSVHRGPARVAGSVRRLVFQPDGGDGLLFATLVDGTGALEVVLPRAQARDWAPGCLVVAEGVMVGSAFVAHAYLPDADDDGVWVEVAPTPTIPA